MHIASGDAHFANGQIRFSHASGNAYKPGGGTWSDISDKRLKKNIRPFEDGLSTIMKLTPVAYKFNNQSGYKDLDREFIGFIAQDIESITPYMVEIVDDTDGVSNLSDMRTVNESALTKILVNAVKEQQTIIEQQNKKIESISKENALLKSELNQIITSNQSLQKQIDKILSVLEVDVKN